MPTEGIVPIADKRGLFTAPTPVRDRWIRLWADKKSRYFVHIIMWIYLSWKERKKNLVINETIKSVRLATIKAQKNNFESSFLILNIALFFLISERDFQSIKIDALTHPNKDKRNILLRYIVLNIIERDIDKVAGQSLKKALNVISLDKNLQQKLFDALREIRKTHEQIEKKYTSLRNISIAHRDVDSLLQEQTIQDIDPKEIFSFASKYYAAAEEFIHLMPYVIAQTGTIKSILNQISYKD